MKLKMRSVVAGAAALVIAGGMLAVTGGNAFAAGVPTYEPDPQAVGTLTFYDATGAQITSGSVNDSPLATYYKASGNGVVAGDNLASISYATPQDGVPTGSWTTVEGWTATGSYGPSANPGFPAGLGGVPNAVVKGDAGDGGLAVHIAAFPSASVANPGVYQIRMYTTVSGGSGTPNYYSADVSVTGSTWTQVYPAVAAAIGTTTTVTASPASPKPVGTSVTFTAHVVPASGSITNGKVQFFDGAAQIGADVPFTGADVSVSTTALTSGTHSITAKYVPSGITFAGSTSAAISYVLTGIVTGTTTGLAVNTGSNAGYSPVTLTATVAPAAAPGTVTFFDGATPIGTSGAGAGTFTLITSLLAPGAHSVTATFTPTDPTAFSSSTSAPSTFTLDAAACAACTDVQGIRVTINPGTLVISTPYTPAAPLTLPDMTLNTSATTYSSSAPFNGISVTDTRPGNLPWTVQAQASTLTNGTPGANNTINGQNVGLTALVAVPILGNALTAASVTTTDNPVPAAALAPTDPGTSGLGNAAHTVLHANNGLGSIGYNGTLTIQAPSSTLPGTYNGTITFTIS